MSQKVIEQSREARRIYLIAIEVRNINPMRAMKLMERARMLARSIRVLVASREVVSR